MIQKDELQFIDDPHTINDTEYYNSLPEDKKKFVDILLQNVRVVDAVKQVDMGLTSFYRWRNRDEKFDQLVQVILRIRRQTGFIPPPLFATFPATEEECLRRGKIMRAMRYMPENSSIFDVDDFDLPTEYKRVYPICYISFINDTEKSDVIRCLLQHDWVPIMSPISTLDDSLDMWENIDSEEPSKFLVPLGSSSAVFLGNGWRPNERCRIEQEYAYTHGIARFFSAEDIVDSRTIINKGR